MGRSWIDLIRLYRGLAARYLGALLLAVLLSTASSSHSQMLNFAAWNQQLALKFTTGSQAISNKNCSGVVNVQTTRSGVAYTTPTNVTVDLTGPANLTFYSDVACATAVTSVTIAAGTSSKDFYFLDTANASATIIATATGTSYSPVQQTHSLSTNGFVWKGTISSAWNTGGNWSGGVVPGPTNRVVFDSTCTNCSPTFASAVTIRHLRMAADYTGTIAQGSFNITIDSGNGTVGDTGFAQIGGTFIGTTNPANSLIVDEGFVTIAGGSFTAPVSTVVVTDGWRVINSPTVTFPVGSTLWIKCNGSYFCYSNTLQMTTGSVTYQNVIINGRRTNYDFGGATVTVAGNMQVGDNMNARGINNGTFNISGNMSSYTANGSYGTANFVLVGNPAGQTISTGANGPLPNITLATGANPVTISGVVKMQKLTITSVGTFNLAGSTLQFYCDSGSPQCAGTTSVLTLGSFTYNNMQFSGFSTNWDLNGGTVTVSGTLTLGDLDSTPSNERISNGTIEAYGNVTGTDYGYFGTATIVVKGNPAGQTITGVVGRGFPGLRIDAGSNPVTLASSIRTVDYNYLSSGTFTTTGSTLHLFCNSSFASLGCTNLSKAVTLGSVTYNNLIFEGFSTAWNLGGGTTTVSGTLTMGDTDSSPSGESINNGTINVTGTAITGTSYGVFGSAWVVLKGNAAGQTITASAIAGRGLPRIRIEAGTNPVTISGFFRTHAYEYISSGTFTATGSTIGLWCFGTVSVCANTSVSLRFGTVTYENVSINGQSTAYDVGGETVTINGNFSFGDLDTTPANHVITNATFRVAGNITQTNEGQTFSATSAVVVATGRPAGQTISGISPKRGLPIQIDTGTNPVTLSTFYRTQSWQVVSVGTFTATGSTLELRCLSGFTTCDNTTAAIALGSVNYNNLVLDGYRTAWDLGGATVNINGNLTMSDQAASNKFIQNGTLRVAGNVIVGTNGPAGNAALQFVGSNPQTMTTSSTVMPSGTVTVNKPSGTVTFASNVNWNQAGQSMTITSGSVDMAGFNLTVNNVLTIGTGTTLTRGFGTLTYGTLVNNGTLNP